MAKILVADDEQRIRMLLGDFLSNAGHVVLEAADGGEALSKLEQQPDIDLVILDVMMPVHDGWMVCREIRARSELPIIMLTARGEEGDQLRGFGLGADDYVPKPFSPTLLLARVAALLRRTHALVPVLQAGPLTIDPAARSVRLLNEDLTLTPTEFDLLHYLAVHRGQVFSREQLLTQVWGFDYLGGTRTVDTHVNRLRSKLGRFDSLLQTVWGFGYRFEVTE